MMFCQPTQVILLISIAGAIFHLIWRGGQGTIWWILVGILGSILFQMLCTIGMSIFAWILMAIPILLVCFFFAIALFTSSVRIQNVKIDDCDCSDVNECE